MGLFGFGKKKEEEAVAPCAYNEGAPRMREEPGGCGIRQVKVLGTGCKKCHELNENARAAIDELGISVVLK